MARPACAIIDLDALRHNYRYAKQLAPGCKAVAVVKANGYGHGAVAVAKALAEDVDMFGVACIEEALQLRDAGIRQDILLLEGFFTADELPLIDRHGLTTVIHHQQQLAQVLASKPRRSLNVWLKMDSGMHRLGLPPPAFAEAYRALSECAYIAEIVLMSHFACADERDTSVTQQQLDTFAHYSTGIDTPRSLANSAAILAWPSSYNDWIRPGLMLYGWSPLDYEHHMAKALKPVMMLRSAIIAIRDLAADEAIGYGRRFVCEQPIQVGVVAMGYGDGYPRYARDGTPVAVNGQRTRLIGRVSMDMLTVDLTPLNHVAIGDPVELWGSAISANEVATACDTIPYTLLTGISPRVPIQSL